MKKLKFLFLTAAILLLSVFLGSIFVRPTLAVDVLGGSGQACNNPDAASKPAICSDNQTNGGNPLLGASGILTKVVRIVSIIVGAAAVIVIVIGGLRMVVSGGESSAVAKARQSIIYALVGLLVAALAQIIVAFVLDKVK
jgi:hypothetical protein